MAIPESQFDIWSKPGAAIGSRDTYQKIKETLESPSAPYASRNFEVFLQGSYGNDTNIYSESDVDIVIHLLDAYIYNIDFLPTEQKASIPLTINGGITYGIDQFKQEVFVHLKSQFGSDVVLGKRSIRIKANGNRRSTDVIVCIGYRQYLKYTPQNRFLSGIIFKDSSGNEIVNYPKYHRENCTSKNLSTNGWFKPTARILKNMRGKLISTGRFNEGDAPSYFLEGMLWNVPDWCFGENYQKTIAKCIDWLNYCEADKLLCANEMYFLLHPTSPVTWRKEKFGGFLGATIDLWHNWQ